MNRKLAFAVAVMALALLAILGVAAREGRVMPGFATSTMSAPVVAASTPVQGLPDFSALVAQVGPAVVNVSTTQKARTGAFGADGDGSSDEDDSLLDFFRRFGIPLPENRGEPMHGVGSGFIVSPDGYVLTNAHVVEDALEVTVRLTDKREFRAKVIGSDRRSDIALLKVDAQGLPTVRIGNPGGVKAGEWVAAIGSPFGFENSVTAGIVSAKARSLPDENYVPFIQTDVAINPGNSGGPLFNMSGEVIGVNSQIYSRTGGYMGLSFAIPIDAAMKVKEQLQKHGKVSRGKLGVAIQSVNRELAESFGLSKPSGALVNSVEPGGPADRAGVIPGDIIVAVDGQAVEDSADLPRMIGERSPGQTVKLQIWRKGKTSDAQATLGEFTERQTTPQRPERMPQDKLGLAVRALSDEEKRALGTNGGLMVEDVRDAAARAGVRPGDVILAVNNERVASAEQLRRLVDASGGRIALLVQRENVKIYIPIKLG